MLFVAASAQYNSVPTVLAVILPSLLELNTLRRATERLNRSHKRCGLRKTTRSNPPATALATISGAFDKLVRRDATTVPPSSPNRCSAPGATNAILSQCVDSELVDILLFFFLSCFFSIWLFLFCFCNFFC